MLEEGEQRSPALLEHSGVPVGCGRFVPTVVAQSRGFPVQRGAGCCLEAGLGSICLNSCTATALPVVNSCSDPSAGADRPACPKPAWPASSCHAAGTGTLLG